MEQTLIPYHAVKHIDGSRVLVFAPHPDDEVFGCGGAILCHVAAGDSVRVMVVSDGGFGVDDENRDEYVLRRQNESREAAKLLGYGEPEFWAERDREIIYGEKLVCQVLEAIRNTGADLVYAPSVFEMHPDHRALGMVAVEAVRRCSHGVRIALYEVGMPLRPNILLDISDLVERKKAAMECFVSQNKTQRYDIDIAALNRYRSYTLPANVTAAEAYVLVTAEELGHDPLKLYQSEHDRQRELGLILDSRDAPLVSVIIRSMDRPMLDDALDSVALQTYPNIEVVVVNAKGSGHREMSEWCGRFSLRMIGTGERLPRSRAANFGLAAAQGKYLIFLDDDDLFDPQHIFNLVDPLTRNPGYKVAYSGVRCINEKNELLEHTFDHPFDPVQLLAGNFIPIHAVLFERSLLDRPCHFDESLDLFEDWDFWLQVSHDSAFLKIEGQTSIYRVLPNTGFGVRADPAIVMAATARIYEKWRNLWTLDDIMKMMHYIRQKRDTDITLAQLPRLESESRDSAQRIQSLTGQVDILNHSLEKTQTALADCQAMLSGKEQQITTIMHSRSWRITRPLRTWASLWRRSVHG